MKILIRLSAIVFLMTVVMGTASAQKMKFGHTNSQKLISEMPEYNNVKVELEALSKKHDTRYINMRAEFEKLAKEYQENEQLAAASSEKWDVLTLEDKTDDLQKLQEKIQNYPSRAQQIIQTKQAELLVPIEEKFKKAIQDVAEAGGYIYIFDEAALLYFSKTLSVDVTADIKKILTVK